MERWGSCCHIVRAYVPGVWNELARCSEHQGVCTPPQYACAGCQCRVNEPYCAAISLLLSVIKWATPEDSLFAECAIVARLSNVIELLNSVLYSATTLVLKDYCNDTVRYVIGSFRVRYPEARFLVICCLVTMLSQLTHSLNVWECFTERHSKIPSHIINWCVYVRYILCVFIHAYIHYAFDLYNS